MALNLARARGDTLNRATVSRAVTLTGRTTSADADGAGGQALSTGVLANPLKVMPAGRGGQPMCRRIFRRAKFAAWPSK